MSLHLFVQTSMLSWGIPSLESSPLSLGRFAAIATRCWWLVRMGESSSLARITSTALKLPLGRLALAIDQWHNEGMTDRTATQRGKLLTNSRRPI